MGTTTDTDDFLDMVDELWALIGEHKRTEIDPSLRDEPFPYNETFIIEDHIEEVIGAAAQTCKETGSQEVPESDRASTSRAASTQYEGSEEKLPLAIATHKVLGLGEASVSEESIIKGASATGGQSAAKEVSSIGTHSAARKASATDIMSATIGPLVERTQSATRAASATEVPAATKKASVKRRASATGGPLTTGRPSATKRPLTSGGESENERSFTLGRTLATLRAEMSNEEKKEMALGEPKTIEGASTTAGPSSSGGLSISGEASATINSLMSGQVLNTRELSTLDVASVFGEASTLGVASTSHTSLMSGLATVAGETTTLASTSKEPLISGGPSTSSAALISRTPFELGPASTLGGASATSELLMSGWALIPEDSLMLSMATISGDASTSGGTLDWVFVSEEVLSPSELSETSSGETLMQGREPISRASTPDRTSNSDEASVTDRVSTPEEILAPGTLTPTNGPQIQRHRTLTVVQRNRTSSTFNSVQVAFDHL